MYDFASVGHLADYINDTVVRSHKHGPVYVQGPYYEYNSDQSIADVELLVKSLPCPKAPSHRVGVEDLDFSPIPIGMCNLLDINGVPVDAAYITRIPARRWKIGLSDMGLRPYPIRYPDVEEFHPWVFNPQSTQSCWLVEEPGMLMINNDYPSYDQAMEYMDPFTRRSCAFSRNFAINCEGQIYYRWHREPVGRCQSKPSLYIRYKDLEEVLEEDGYQESIAKTIPSF